MAGDVRLRHGLPSNAVLNVALAPGASGLVVVDLDGPGAVTAFAEDALAHGDDVVDWLMTVSPGWGGGRHVLFGIEPGETVRLGKQPWGGEVRARTRLVHPNRGVYRVTGARLPMIPPWLRDTLGGAVRLDEDAATGGAATHAETNAFLDALPTPARGRPTASRRWRGCLASWTARRGGTRGWCARRCGCWSWPGTGKCTGGRR